MYKRLDSSTLVIAAFEIMATTSEKRPRISVHMICRRCCLFEFLSAYFIVCGSRLRSWVESMVPRGVKHMLLAFYWENESAEVSTFPALLLHRRKNRKWAWSVGLEVRGGWHHFDTLWPGHGEGDVIYLMKIATLLEAFRLGYEFSSETCAARYCVPWYVWKRVVKVRTLVSTFVWWRFPSETLFSDSFFLLWVTREWVSHYTCVRRLPTWHQTNILFYSFFWNKHTRQSRVSSWMSHGDWSTIKLY